MLGVYNMPKPQDSREKCDLSCMRINKGWHRGTMYGAFLIWVLIDFGSFLNKGSRPQTPVDHCWHFCVPETLFWGYSTPMLKDWRKHSCMGVFQPQRHPLNWLAHDAHAHTRFPVQWCRGRRIMADDIPQSCDNHTRESIFMRIQSSLPNRHRPTVAGMLDGQDWCAQRGEKLYLISSRDQQNCWSLCINMLSKLPPNIKIEGFCKTSKPNSGVAKNLIWKLSPNIKLKITIETSKKTKPTRFPFNT